MKILVISNYRSIVITRPEAEIFIALKQKGHDVSIMTYADAAYIPRFEEVGIKVIKFHPEKKRHLPSIKFIRQQLIEGEYDVLQMFNSLAYLSGIPAAKGLPVKVVLYRGYSGNVAWYDPFIYLKYFHPRVNGVIAVVEPIRQLLVRNAPWARHKFRTIHKGHDPAWYTVNKQADLSTFNVNDNEVKFVCVANARKMKGVSYLLRATHLLQADTPIQLFLVGKDMDTPEFLKLIDESPLKDKIHITGYRTDALEFVSACDVFVLASLYGEGLNKALIEAMCLEKASLITDIPENSILIDHQKTGLLVPKANEEAIANAMLYYLANREIIKEYGKAARQHIATELNIADTVNQYEQFYLELINS